MCCEKPDSSMHAVTHHTVSCSVSCRPTYACSWVCIHSSRQLHLTRDQAKRLPAAGFSCASRRLCLSDLRPQHRPICSTASFKHVPLTPMLARKGPVLSSMQATCTLSNDPGLLASGAAARQPQDPYRSPPAPSVFTAQQVPNAQPGACLQAARSSASNMAVKLGHKDFVQLILMRPTHEGSLSATLSPGPACRPPGPLPATWRARWGTRTLCGSS